MNKIDLLLNGISYKHLGVELISHGPRVLSLQPSSTEIHAALLAAFVGGIRHAERKTGASTAALIREVDICVD